MAPKRTTPFNPQSCFTKVGQGKTLLQARKHQQIFSQGAVADAVFVFYIQAGQVRLSILSQQGKEAVVAMLKQGSFWGKGVSPGSWWHGHGDRCGKLHSRPH